VRWAQVLLRVDPVTAG